MADTDSKVPKGPGQQEVTGEIRNPRDANPLGTYKDPESGKTLEVSMHAGADALDRMGWKHVAPLQGPKPDQVPQDDSPEPEPTENPAPLPDKTDDADRIEEEQDNAAGHKVEGQNDTPGVPAGDPADLQKESAAAKQGKPTDSKTDARAGAGTASKK